MAGYKVNDTDLDALLEPWQSGDGYAASTGYLINGYDLNEKYAPASAGTAFSGTTGYNENGTDVGPRFCAKGTRNTPLPIDGATYSYAGIAGGTLIIWYMNSDGTYVVQSGGGGTVFASGPWLPSGGIISQYTCEFSWVQTILQSGGTFTNATTAPTPEPLTTTQSMSSGSHAGAGGGTAEQSVYVTMNLYRSGILVSTTHVTLDTLSESF